MLMGFVEVRINQSQQDADEEPKSRWVSCPDMPDGLLTVDDETLHRIPKEEKKVEEVEED